MATLKRWIVLISAGLIGAAAAGAYAVYAFPASSEASRALSKSDAEWVKMATVMETCSILFAVMYLSGGALALLFRAADLAKEIKRNGRWHTTILEALLLLITAQRLWFTREGSWRRFDNVFAIACMGVLIVLGIVFKLGIGRTAGTPQEQ